MPPPGGRNALARPPHPPAQRQDIRPRQRTRRVPIAARPLPRRRIAIPHLQHRTRTAAASKAPVPYGKGAAKAPWPATAMSTLGWPFFCNVAISRAALLCRPSPQRSIRYKSRHPPSPAASTRSPPTLTTPPGPFVARPARVTRGRCCVTLHFAPPLAERNSHCACIYPYLPTHISVFVNTTPPGT